MLSNALNFSYYRNVKLMLFLFYLHFQISGTDFVLFLVTADDEKLFDIRKLDEDALLFSYHRFDLDDESFNTCKYYNRKATIGL